MIRIGTVWDSAVEAVRGRAGMIAPIAALTLFLPSVVQTGLQSYLTPLYATAGGLSGLVLLIMVAVLLVTFWGALAITAITSRPETTSADAGQQATARLLPLVGVSIVLGFAMSLVTIPFFVLLAAAGVDFTTLSPGATPPVTGTSFLAVMYLLAIFALLLWLFARLLPLVPTVLHERIGLRAIGRAFRLTRGMGLKLVGAVLLYLVVLIVASGAAQLVAGLVARLLFGPEGIAAAQFVGGVAGAVVSTMLSVLSYAFIARLYMMLSGRDRAGVFEDAPAAA